MVDSVSVLCGQLLVIGPAKEAPSRTEREALACGHRGGVVFFRRHTSGGPRAVAELARAVQDLAPSDLPPLVAVDQEGGRVVRLGPPLIELPPMRVVGDLGDEDFATRLAEAHARELRALGFTLSFAPVCDVHTREENPIIGDRAFGTTPEVVARMAGAWADGLARAGLSTCAKHFPGHGDTTVDSHLALPRVDRAKPDLARIEIAPFRSLARRPSIHSMMTAHVVYDALDPERPATLSHAICTDFLRTELGFEGALFSDDLEMKAIAIDVGEAAVLAVQAGCDVLLVCSNEELAERAHAALVREAEASPAFRARCEEAFARALRLRRRHPSRAITDGSTLARIFSESAPIRADLATRLGRALAP